AGDEFIPRQLWWALEAQITRDRQAVVAAFADETLWARPLVKQHLIAKLGQRFTAERIESNLAICAKLLALAPNDDAVAQLIAGMEVGLRGAVIESVPAAFDATLAELWTQGTPDARLIGFAMRLGSADALKAARRF